MGKQSDRDYHANQLYPSNDAYWQARREDERPDDWEKRERGDDKGPGDKAPARRN